VDPRRTLLLTLFDLRHSVFKVKGLLFLLPFLLYWLAILQLLHDGGAEFVVSQQGMLISTLLLTPDVTRALFIDNPAVLSMALMLGLTTLPLFCMLAGCNQLAADAGRNSFRFLLTRCTRSELFVSRYLSACLLVAVALGLLIVAVTLMSLHIDRKPLPATLSYAAWILAVLVIYALPLIAFMSIFSSMMSGTVGAFLSGSAVFFVLMTISRWLDDDYPAVFYVLPNSLKASLYDVYSPDIIMTLAAMLAYSMIYLSLGWLLFQRRGV